MKSGNNLIGASLLTAITSSLCCITPILALIAGTSGMASTFSWIESFRPYLIGLTILLLSFVWYFKLKGRKEIDCKCETEGKPKYIESKMFLAVVTLFAFVMLTFPYYAGLFYPNTGKQIIRVDQSDIQTTEYKIRGMTCASCEEQVKYKVNKLNGILNVKVSYEDKNAIIKFDRTKTNEMIIEKVISSTGYKVTNKN
jgi:copper chaperone CopZ